MSEPEVPIGPLTDAGTGKQPADPYPQPLVAWGGDGEWVQLGVDADGNPIWGFVK